MKCPRDGTALDRVNVLGTELDKCHHCDGLWLDHGEMDRLAAAKVSDVEDRLERQYGDPKVEPGEVSDYMRCPRCEGRLQRAQYTYIKPVKIDRCESCLGVWVDDGELDAIVSEKSGLDEAYAPGRLKLLLRSMSRAFKN